MTQFRRTGQSKLTIGARSPTIPVRKPCSGVPDNQGRCGAASSCADGSSSSGCSGVSDNQRSLARGRRPPARSPRRGSGVPDNQRLLARPVHRDSRRSQRRFRRTGQSEVASAARCRRRALVSLNSGVPDNQKLLTRRSRRQSAHLETVPAYRTIKGRWCVCARNETDVWAGVPAYRTIRNRWRLTVATR